MVIVSDFELVGKGSDCAKFVISKNLGICPICQNRLKHRDWKRRILKRDSGEKEFINIERALCTNKNCRKIHSVLPDMLVPYKHYVEDLITGVLDGDIVPEDLANEDYPCDETMRRWNHWFVMNYFRIEGYIRSVIYRYSDNRDDTSLLTAPLLEAERKKNNRWLSAILRTIYNSGGFLEAVW